MHWGAVQPPATQVEPLPWAFVHGRRQPPQLLMSFVRLGLAAVVRVVVAVAVARVADGPAEAALAVRRPARVHARDRARAAVEPVRRTLVSQPSAGVAVAVGVARIAAAWQIPPAQLTDPPEFWHFFPQVPQLFTSVWVLTSQPLIGFPSQLAAP